MYGKIKPLGSVNSLLLFAPQLSGVKSCFLVHLKEWQVWQMAAACVLPTFSAIIVGGRGSCWIAVLGALTHIWRPEIDDDCDICLLIWQDIFSFHSGYLHSTSAFI